MSNRYRLALGENLNFAGVKIELKGRFQGLKAVGIFPPPPQFWGTFARVRVLVAKFNKKGSMHYIKPFSLLVGYSSHSVIVLPTSM